MSDFLERNGLQTVAQHFKDLFLASVHRDGAEELLERLENETDFFEAPAGAKHHGAFPGGLVIHSLNVYRRLREITIRDLTPRDALGPAPISEREEETVAILGLLHDVCKAGVYHIERKRRRNPETGVWEDYLSYTFRDPLPLGHGEKSLYQIARFIRLEDHEALAIRWHMGAYLVMYQNPQGCFTAPSGKTVPPKEAMDKLDRMAQSLGELIDREDTLLRNILESDRKRK